MELLAWWNLIFVLPFTAALFYLLFQTFTGLAMEHGADADADMDHDADLGVDHDVDAGIDHDADVGVDHDTGIEHTADLGHGHALGHADEAGALLKALSFLGIGRVPISVVAMTFCFIWGFTGWASNQVLGPVLRYPALYVWPSIAVAILCTTMFTRLTVRGLSRIMPSTESYGTSNVQLVGRRAKAIYPITSTSGSARLHDDYGNLLEVSCRTKPEEPAIPAGSSVILLRYDPQSTVFLVKHDPLDNRFSSETSDHMEREET